MQTVQRTVYLPSWLQQFIHSKPIDLEVIAPNMAYHIPPKMLGGYSSIQYSPMKIFFTSYPHLLYHYHWTTKTSNIHGLGHNLSKRFQKKIIQL